jgi:hypothetical protein
MTHFMIVRTNVADGQVLWSDKCQVGQMSVGQTSVGQTSVGQKSRHRLLVEKLQNDFCPINFP